MKNYLQIGKNMTHSRIFFTLIATTIGLFSTHLHPLNLQFAHLVPISQTSSELTLHIALEQHESLYTEYLSFATDTQDVSITKWKTAQPLTSSYDHTSKSHKQALTKNSDISITLHHQHAISAPFTVSMTTYAAHDATMKQ